MIGIANTRITDIVVDEQAAAEGGRVTMHWRDEVGAPRAEHFHGHFAGQFSVDLKAVTLMGEGARHGYLIGRIREIERLSG